MMVIAVNDGLGGRRGVGSDAVMQIAVTMHAINSIGFVIVVIWLMMLGRTMQSGTIGGHNSTSADA